MRGPLTWLTLYTFFPDYFTKALMAEEENAVHIEYKISSTTYEILKQHTFSKMNIKRHNLRYLLI